MFCIDDVIIKLIVTLSSFQITVKHAAMRGTRFVSFIKKASTKVAIIEINGIGAILAAKCSFMIKLET